MLAADGAAVKRRAQKKWRGHYPGNGRKTTRKITWAGGYNLRPLPATHDSASYRVLYMSASPQTAPESFRAGPDERGHFGGFGGRFVAETLMPLILEVERAYMREREKPGVSPRL